ncbi:MAG: glycosyltransferase [Coriobacteriaceae bacterium]|nr:MAG: glycosyltransferase [Coriobacteriaceae bacterium]
MNRILVLMATYNGEKYLKKQLNSIFAQENVDVTVLARDDGSSDRTTSILDDYSKSHSLSWYSGKHLNVSKGYYSLMQKGAHQDFDYYAFSDQDDVWDIDKLSIGIAAIADMKKPALYYCGQRLVDANLTFIADHELNKDRSLTTRFILSDFAGCTGVFNKALINEVVSYMPSYMLMHDTWILKVCLALGGVVIVDPKSHMSYRQHGGNAVGLGRSLPAYLKQVKQYLNEYKVEPQMRELIKGYGDRMVNPYKEIVEACCNYRTDRQSRRLLLDRSTVDFCARGLNLTYRLKVFSNRL